MKNILTFVSILVAITFIFSCAENKPIEKNTSITEHTSNLITDTLKFASGITAIFQDSKGRYWIGSQNEGACYYNGTYFNYFTTIEGLPSNQIRSIQEDSNGNIWFGTSNGVSYFDGISIQNISPIENVSTPNDWVATETDLWFNAGPNQGVYKYDGQNLWYLAFPNPKIESSYNLYSLTALSKGKNNMLWFATYAGVFGYNGHQFTVLNDETLGFNNDSYKLHVRSILEDSKGRVWIGNNGIGVLLKEGDSVKNFSKEQGKLISMNEFIKNTSNNEFAKNTGLQSVFAIEEDTTGNIWFSDRDTGIWMYDGKSLANIPIENSNAPLMARTIYKDSNHNLLFGMAEGGIYTFNGNYLVKWV